MGKNPKAFRLKCEECGSIYERVGQNAKGARFCSKECYYSAYREVRICKKCKEEFTTIKSGNKVYCSAACTTKPVRRSECRRCGKEFKNPKRRVYCSLACRYPSVGDRFWSKVDIQEEDECWVWKAGKNTQGYGLFSVNGISIGAHRAAWALHNGPIPEGKYVCHRCDNPLCVNPAHLFVGTARDNFEDARNKGRVMVGSSGEENPNSRLTQEEVNAIRQRTDKSKRGLAREYGVSDRLIGKILRDEVWVDN